MTGRCVSTSGSSIASSPLIRRLAVLGLLGAALLPFPASLAGQEGEGVAVDSVSGALRIDVARYLEDAGLRRALHSGLPVRMEVRTELWRDGFFDSQAGDDTWRASVVHDAVSRSYDVTVAEGPTVSVGTLEEAALVLQAGFASPLRPREEGRYYYLAQVELQTLSLSDLEELGRWLQGDLGPAVSGERAPETAVTRGLRRLMVRALGLPARRERLRSPSFQWSPPPAP